jgi:adenylyl- and sulfurtransferase ThiI
MVKKTKVIVMFSGGLDSRLVVKIIQKQQLEIIAIYFKLPFSKDVEKEIKEFCEENKIKLKIFDCTKGELFQEYLDVIKNPKHGRGAGINPCIDCKIFMLRKAKKFADRKGIEYIVTGEVIGQRPLSQTKKATQIIEEKAGLKNRIIRPLVEFYKIQGRKRDKQITLAKKFGISYPAPAGGCLLCEKLYCKKLKKILNEKNLSYKDIQLLKIGRHFESSQIILGKNKTENKLLEREKGIKIIPKQVGPTALIKSRKFWDKAKKLIQKYSKHKIKDFTIKNV